MSRYHQHTSDAYCTSILYPKAATKTPCCMVRPVGLGLSLVTVDPAGACHHTAELRNDTHQLAPPPPTQHDSITWRWLGQPCFMQNPSLETQGLLEGGA